MLSAVDVERLLRGAGLRVTSPRLAVLAAVHARPHGATDSIARIVRERLGAVSDQAVYDVLRALTAAGLVRRIEPAGSVARYEARVGDNHHHVICRSCGAIADVDCAVGSAPCLTASDDAGFAIDEAEVVYWGRCQNCAVVTSTSPGKRQTGRTPGEQPEATEVDNSQPDPSRNGETDGRTRRDRHRQRDRHRD